MKIRTRAGRPASRFRYVTLATVMCGCALAGETARSSTPIDPNKISDFNVLYGENCAGCHGPDGRGGAAVALGDPSVSSNRRRHDPAPRGDQWNSGTSMPAFAQSAGGMLTEKQIDLIVHGIRERWSQPNVLAVRTRLHILPQLRATLCAARRCTPRSARLAMASPAREQRRRVPSLMDLFSRSHGSGASHNCDRRPSGPGCSRLAK